MNTQTDKAPSLPENCLPYLPDLYVFWPIETAKSGPPLLQIFPNFYQNYNYFFTYVCAGLTLFLAPNQADNTSEGALARTTNIA